MLNRLSVYYPLKVFIYSWAAIFLVRTFGLMDYASIKLDTYILIMLFIGAFIGGFFLSLSLFSKRFSTLNENNDSNVNIHLGAYKHLKILIYISFVLSVICIGAMSQKISSLASNYSSEISLEGVSQIRGSVLGDESYEVGGNIYGIISNILFGFPVLCGILLLAYKSIISSLLKILLLAGFLGGIIASFMTGGRFMAFTFILFYIYGEIIRPKGEKKTNLRRKIIIIVFLLGFIWISSIIFLDRMNNRDVSDVVYLLPLCYPKDFTIYILKIQPNLTSLYIYFEYYLAHGINQLDIALNAPYPLRAPYLGAYSFKTVALVLNKIGFNLITSTDIVNDIVNPGVYFTEIGALYIDFGYILSILFTFVFSFTFSINWMNYRCKSGFISFFNCITFLTLTIASPVVSLISSGYFSSILVAIICVCVYSKVFKLPKLS
ncbi:O-antigen polymerase [Emticicia agri]|uniref:Oligosaccharide repeat unit polymerase n=1 Tax=Emticicia agri TaxID=2492393 RepID=A0A4Q5LTQ3_9BACT|nr:O-antigen polymerase [Emticicia agri]RYU92895.1 oligosaccharide repeat unit polymerase [Emticicia agri]